MKSSTKTAAKSARDISYYRQRYKNRVYAKLVSWISDEAKRQQLTKKDIAERLNKDPGQISRLLKQSSNLTLDTISDLLLAFDAEAEPPEITKPAPNYIHPLMARVLNVDVKPGILKVDSTTSKVGMLRPPNPAAINFKIINGTTTEEAMVL
jgi:transcriptional regulator with XRE-family HTH domain